MISRLLPTERALLDILLKQAGIQLADDHPAYSDHAVRERDNTRNGLYIEFDLNRVDADPETCQRHTEYCQFVLNEELDLMLGSSLYTLNDGSPALIELYDFSFNGNVEAWDGNLAGFELIDFDTAEKYKSRTPYTE
ncbi:MAG: hypothetical protein RLN76_01085 [Phycisphaeraceae bacterium]